MASGAHRGVCRINKTQQGRIFSILRRKIFAKDGVTTGVGCFAGRSAALVVAVVSNASGWWWVVIITGKRAPEKWGV